MRYPPPPFPRRPVLTDVVGVAAGKTHSLALKKDGTVVTWGSKRCGESTMPAELE